MELRALETGATLWLEDGSLVEVLAPSVDGVSVHVRYVESPFDEALVGTDRDCTDYEIISHADTSDHADSSAL